MIRDYNPKLSSKCMEIIECDTARISNVDGNLFLIIGFDRNTKDDPGQWHEVDQDGTWKARDWDYIREKVVASGQTEEGLIQDAWNYKRLTEIGKVSLNI